MTKTRFGFITAVYLLLEKDGKILLLQRQNSGYYDSSYSLIAGHVEEGESLTDGMMREAFEEAGIMIQAKDLTLAHVLCRPSIGRIAVFFSCKSWQGTIENKEPDKCSELGWYKIDQLPSNTVPELPQAIENYRKGVLYSDFEEL